MAIHDSNTGAKGTLYRGNYEPAEWSVGNKKITGWKEETQTGTAMTFEDTYNDKFLAAKVKGDSVQKSEWVHKTGESAQKTGVQGTNLITNGDFSAGTTGWSVQNGTLSSSGNILSVTSNGTGTLPRCIQNINVPYADSVKIYVQCSMRVNNPSCISVNVRLVATGMSTQVAEIQSAPQAGVWYRKGVVIASVSGGTSGNFGVQFATQYASPELGAGKITDLQYPIAINLTDTFGAGNEPTVSQMDAMLAQYPDSWFDGTNWLTTDSAYTANSPSPDYPQPITTTIPADTYRVQDYKGDWYEFTLPSDLHGVGDVRDSVEWDRMGHRGYLRTNNNKIVFDGVTAGRRLTTKNADAGDYKGFLILKSGVNWITGNAYNQCMVSHFEGYSWIGTGVPEGNYWWYAGTSTGMRLHKDYMPGYDDLTTDAQRIAAANAWLSDQYTNGTPVTIIYQLATPTRTPLTFTLNNASTAPELPLDFLTSEVSPDYPATIFSAGDCEVQSKGRNLFDAGKFADVSPAQYEYENDYLVVKNLDGRAWATVPVSLNLRAGSYTITRSNTVGNLQIRTSEDNYVQLLPGEKSKTFTLSNDASIKLKEGTGAATYPLYSKIQLESGPISTPYRPYFPPSSIQLPELSSLPDGTADTLEYMGNGEWKHTQRVQEVVFDGVITRLGKPDAAVNSYLYTKRVDTKALAALYSTHFRHTSLIGSPSGAGTCTGIYGDKHIYINMYGLVSGDNATTPNADEANAWLAAQYAAGTPVIVKYKLATPIETILHLGELKTYPHTTIAEVHNDTPAKAEITATVKTVDLN